MNKITLNFTGLHYLGEIHRELKQKFGFPDYYGENLDALWDCLGGYCSDPLTVELKGLCTLPGELDDYMSRMMEVFNDVHRDAPNITFSILS